MPLDGGVRLEVELVERVGPEVADEDVGRGEQALEVLPFVGVAQVEGTLRLPRLSRVNAGLGMSSSMPSDPNTLRIGSPVGGSTLMTSAPQSASSARPARTGRPPEVKNADSPQSSVTPDRLTNVG